MPNTINSSSLRTTEARFPDLPATGRAAGFVLAVWFTYLLFASTNGFAWIPSWHNEQRAVQLVLLLGTALVVLAVYLGSGLRELPMFPWPFWVVLSAALVSSFFAEFRFAAFAEVGLYTALAGLVFISAIGVRSLRGSSLLLQRAILLLGFAHCLGILVRYGTALWLQRELATDVLLLGFANPRFASALYVLLMPFLASHALCPGERKVLRTLAFATLVMLWAFNLALGTRAVLFASGIGMAGFVWLAWKRAPFAIIRTMLASLAAGAILYVAMFQLVPSWVTGSAALAVRADPVLSPNGRDLLLSSSIASIQGAPLLGIGPMQFAAIPHVWAAHPHNWVLQLAAEYGLAISGFLLLSLAAWFRRLRERIASVSAHSTTLLEPALLVTLIGLVYGLVDGNLVMPISQTAAAIGLGALLASLPPGSDRTAVFSVNRHATGIAVAVAAAVVSLYGHTSFAEQEVSVKRFREVYVKDRYFVPRFWEQGLLIHIGATND